MLTPELAIKLGWYVFPARWGYSQKRKGHTHIPLVSWGTESTTDIEKVREWELKYPDAYFCVDTARSNITIYDIDDKNGKAGTVTSDTNEMIHGELPSTLEVQTPSGGRHLYFQGSTKTGSNRFGEGVDSTVMAPLPGSNVVGKGIYRLLKTLEEGEPLPPTPQWCMDMAGKGKEERSDHGTESSQALNLDNPLAVAQAAIYLQSAPPVIRDSGGDDTAYRVIAATRDHGLSESVAQGLVLQYYLPRCYSVDPDWLREKVRNVYRYAEKSLSETDVSSGFGAVEIAEEIEKERTTYESPELVNWCDLVEQPKPREWVVPGLIPMHEITAFYGEGASGKSLLALQLIVSINKNVLWLGHVLKHCKTLYVSGEDDREELKRRAFNIKGFAGISDVTGDLGLWPRAGRENLLVTKGRVKLQTGPFYDELCGMLKSMGEGHKFLVLDTISDIFGGDENDRADVSQFIKHYLKALCMHHDCTILLLGHTNKQGNASGSTGWINACRSQLQIARHDNKNLSNYRRLWTGKSNYGASGADTEQLVEWVDGVFIERLGSEVVDSHFDQDVDIYLGAVVDQCKTGRAFGAHHSSPLYIHRGMIKRPDGSTFDQEESKAMLAELVRQGLVDIIKGEKHGNGVWPT